MEFVASMCCLLAGRMLPGRGCVSNYVPKVERSRSYRGVSLRSRSLQELSAVLKEEEEDDDFEQVPCICVHFELTLSIAVDSELKMLNLI